MSHSQVNFKVGDAVKIKVGTEHYGEDKHYNPADIAGIVVRVKTPDDGGYMYDVRWETDCSNVYRPEDLELVVSAPIPTEDLQSELEEALVKIDTLESALEDAVRELISLRERNNTAVIDVNQRGFKPISEMTLEDWEAAQSLGWVFETNVGSVDTVRGLDYIDPSYPVCFFNLGWKTLDGFENYHEDSRTECDVNITRRVE